MTGEGNGRGGGGEVKEADDTDEEKERGVTDGQKQGLNFERIGAGRGFGDGVSR